MKRIIIDSVIESSYGDETCWIQYCMESVDSNNVVKNKIGYWLTDNVTEKTNLQILEELINTDSNLLDRCLEKPFINDTCSKFLSDLINDCLESEEDMLYVDYEDMGLLDITQKMLDSLKVEVEKLGIWKYINIDDGEYAVCVYGGIITKFLF